MADRELTAEIVARDCIAVRLRMLNRVVTNVYDESLRELDLKVSQLNVLVAMAMMGVAKPADISEKLSLDTSTLSRNLDRMRARGWLEVVPSTDRRAQPVRLTAAGKKLLREALPRWKEAQDQVAVLLGDGVVQQLKHALQRVGSTLN